MLSPLPRFNVRAGRFPALVSIFSVSLITLVWWLSTNRHEPQRWAPVSGSHAAAGAVDHHSVGQRAAVTDPVPGAKVLTQTTPDDAMRARLSEAYGELPLQFEANEGQAPADVRFLSRGNGYTLFLKPNEAVFSIKRFDKSKTDRRKPETASEVRLNLLGSNHAARMGALDELPGKVNYFIGNDPAKWQPDIRTYQKVGYADVYPDIDLVYYGKQGQLEYDFVVAPGADPGKIHLSFEGTDHVRIDEYGALSLKIGEIELRQSKPFVYQQISGRKQEVEGHYVLRAQSEVTIEVDDYDRTKPLIIDPTLTFSKFLETGGGRGQGIAVDALGNAYIVAQHFGSSIDVLVTKLNAAGDTVIYSTILSGVFTDDGRSIAVDGGGNAYITGSTNSRDFPTANAMQPALGGTFESEDAFLTKLNPAGNVLVYSTFFGGSTFDTGNAIAVNAAGNPYIVGLARSTDFPTLNPIQATKNPGFSDDAFISKFNSTGSALIYSTYLGGANEDSASAIALDPSDNAYITGSTESTNFPTTVNARQPAFGGGFSEAFVAKINPLGTALLYSTYHGGNGEDSGSGIAVDTSGNAYVTGFTTSSNFPVANALQPSLKGVDAFISKFNPTGNSLVYSTYLGGTSSEFGNGIAVESGGSVCITGTTSSTDFPLVLPLQTSSAGLTDIFIAKLNTAGSAVTFSTYLGSSGDDESSDVVLDSAGNILITGAANASNFPSIPPPAEPNNSALRAFVAKIDFSQTNYYVIKGRVFGANANVLVTLSGSASRTFETNSSGNYMFQVLSEGGTYTVTPTPPAGLQFDPPNRTYSNLSSNVTDADFRVPPPPNDNFADAQVITNTSTPITGTNVGATVEPGEDTFTSASVWYRLQAPATSGVILNYGATIGGMTIDVFTGSSLGALTRVSGQSSICNFSTCTTVAASFKATADTVYFIRVASTTGNTGNFGFSFASGVTISGHVRNVNGRDLSASVRALRVDTGAVTSTSNNANGYSLVVPPGFTYDVLANLSPVNSFSSSIFSNLTQDVGNVNFTASSPTITISGFLINMTSSAGVSIAATGTGISSKPCEIINSSNTFTYKCSSLSIYGDYTIVPTSSNYAFSPTTRTFVNAGGDTAASFSVTQVQLPAATTAAATNVTTTTATLNGSINPNGVTTNAWFEWGTSDTLATNTSTTPQDIGSGTIAVPVSANLTNLSAGTTYYFRAVGMSSAGTTRGSILSFTTPVQVTVQTNPAGRSFSVDGGPTVTTAQVLEWTPGSSHTITTTSPQAATADTRFVWSSWSDSGAISHTITAPTVSTTYTANFATQYLLTMTAGAGGAVNPASGFFNSGQSVQIIATPNTGFIFNDWIGTGAGSFTGLTNQTNVRMNGPITQTANFISTAGLLLVLESNGQIPNQVLALDATTLLRDPFPVTSPYFWLYSSDPNTRLTIFVQHFQPESGELPSAVVVNLVGSNNQSFDVPAEAVRSLDGTDLTQITFRLPNLPIGTCVIKVKAHNATTNSGTLRIRL